MQTAAPGPAAPAVTHRRQKLRHVIYKSKALERTAPNLVAAATPEAVSAARSIQAANATAERVRLSYKAGKDAPPADVDGDDDASNAKKYERRLKMNRHSAAASRVRREAYTKALEAELVNMEASYRHLLEQLEAERARNNRVSELQVDIERIEEDPDSGDVNHEALADAAAAVDYPVDAVPPQSDELDFDFLNFPPQIHPQAQFSASSSVSAPSAAPQSLPPSLQQLPKMEDLLADVAFCGNADILQSLPLADSLPECFGRSSGPQDNMDSLDFS